MSFRSMMRNGNGAGKAFAIPIVAAVAAALLAGCSDSQTQCVDANGNVLPDSACQSTSSSPGSAGYIRPHWATTGYSGGGSDESDDTSRGGFGESGDAHGGFGGGE